MASRMRASILAPTLLLFACTGGEVDDGRLTFNATAPTGAEDTTTMSTSMSTETSDSAQTTDTDETGSTETGGASCGDGIVDPGEECDMGADNGEAAQCTPECAIAACGDGYVFEGFEDCDDGNDDDTDDCVEGCALASCGDGFVHEGVEACDDGNDDDADMCNSRCMPGACGDGVIQAGEQCDDGNDETGDACPACQLAFCGDGFIQDGVEVCDDGNIEATDACLPVSCELASCGDGFIQDGVEDCDDGNLDDDDACPTSCMPAVCGDGFVQAGVEECDDANMIDDDSCTNMCIALTKRVFVTSEMFDGNLGGLEGADQNCQELADAANLGGVFMAWISTNEGSPSTRFTQSTTAYALVDGTQIAANWAALIDGNIDAPINLDENGEPGPIGNTSCGGGGQLTTWSATSAAGTASGSACSNFTSTAGSGQWGNGGMTNGSWSSWCSGGVCTWTSPIYCFQQ